MCVRRAKVSRERAARSLLRPHTWQHCKGEAAAAAVSPRGIWDFFCFSIHMKAVFLHNKLLFRYIIIMHYCKQPRWRRRRGKVTPRYDASPCCFGPCFLGTFSRAFCSSGVCSKNNWNGRAQREAGAGPCFYSKSGDLAAAKAFIFLECKDLTSARSNGATWHRAHLFSRKTPFTY